MCYLECRIIANHVYMSSKVCPQHGFKQVVRSSAAQNLTQVQSLQKREKCVLTYDLECRTIPKVSHSRGNETASVPSRCAGAGE